MKISRIRIRIIVHENEDKELLKNKFIELLLKDIDLKKIKIEENVGEGLFSYKLYVITIYLDKKKIIDQFFKNLFGYIDIDYFLKNCNFDEGYNIYIRMDKNDLLFRNKINLKYQSDAIQIKFSIDGYNKNKENIENFIKDYINKIVSQ